MNLLSDIITYVRRIIKSPSNTQITDALIVDYINRFWTQDVDARIQLFDLKTVYRFETSAGIANYQMPLYDVQTPTVSGSTNISFYPVYQGFMAPCFANGIQMPFYSSNADFWNLWPNYLQSLPTAAEGDGTANYDLTLPFFPAIPGYVDITGIAATGTNADPPTGSTINTSIPQSSIYSGVFFTAVDSTGVTRVVADSGQFLTNNVGYGLLYAPGTNPYGYQACNGGYSTTLNTVNYAAGTANVTFTDSSGAAVNIPSGNDIQAQCYFYQQGIPRAVMFYNNTITLRPPPNIPYVIEMTAYKTPAAFLAAGEALPFAYMSEYIARGAARKILSDTGDVEQFTFYEPLFKEQELLVWKRSQRQFTSTRTPTIFSEFGFWNSGSGIGGQGGSGL